MGRDRRRGERQSIKDQGQTKVSIEKDIQDQLLGEDAD